MAALEIRNIQGPVCVSFAGVIVTEIRISLARRPQTAASGPPNGPRRITGLKAALMLIFLAAVSAGFVIAVLIVGSIVAAVILGVVAIILLMAAIRSGFRRLSQK